MGALNLDYLSSYVHVSNNARTLLDRSEKEITTYLAIRIDADIIIAADCYVVYHNLVRGPAKGGIRMDASVTLDETRELAERMTYKSALVGIPFGGGKSGIRLDPKPLTRFQKTALLREYCHVLQHELQHSQYIPAPDMGTDATDMAIIYGRLDRLDVVTGKPPRIGGLPGRNEATGYGVARMCSLIAHDHFGMDANSLRVAIQGFGNVGSWSARFLHDMGAKVVAVSDISGAIFDGNGLDVPRLVQEVEHGATLAETGHEPLSNEELLALDADILVPAASGGQITGTIATRCATRAIVEGANGPTTADADAILADRNIPVVPDILANSGGVVASYVEWRNAKSGSITDRHETYEFIDRILTKAYDRVGDVGKAKQVPLRTAAEILALQEVIAAMNDRGWV